MPVAGEIYAGSAPEDAQAYGGWVLGQTVVLARQGDYVVFHGVDHSWFAEQDSVIVAIRWPSVAGYAVPQELRLEARTAGRYCCDHADAGNDRALGPTDAALTAS
jgi:hypothetical protein